MEDSAVQCAHDPLYEVDPETGVSIEVFHTDRALETFGRGGAGWFWWPRRRGCWPEGPATGPFTMIYAAYRNAMCVLRGEGDRPFSA
jgi:hypothetical protein